MNASSTQIEFGEGGGGLLVGQSWGSFVSSYFYLAGLI